MEESAHLLKKQFKNPEEQNEYQLKVIHNIKLIRDVMRDLRPESLILELCEDRYSRWLEEVVGHPNYDDMI